MKLLSIILAVVLASISLCAQSPTTMSHEFTVNNSTGTPVASRTIAVRASILQGSSSGAAVYVETHAPTTDANALARINVGDGTVVSGTYGTIDWSAGPYYIKTEVDIAGGSNFGLSNTTQMLSVPFSLRSKTAESVTTLNQGQVRLSEQSSNGTNYVAVQSTANLSDNYTLTLPVDDGNSGQVLTTNGSGVLSWETPSSGSGGSGGFTHYIGEQYVGGIVFHVWKDNAGTEHGLVVNLNDQSTSNSWSTVLFVSAGASSSWNGVANTNVILGQTGHTASAAKLCNDLNTGGVQVWYLPSVDELSLLWQSRFSVNKTLAAIVASGGSATELSTAFAYWTSTERNAGNAFYYDFSFGYVWSAGKSNTFATRAIRAF